MERNDSGERGSATVEFALVFGLIATILFSIIEFGMFMNTRLVITTAAREGARKAAVDGGASEQAIKRIEDVLGSAGIKPEMCKISITPKAASYGCAVKTRLEYTYTVRAPLAGLIAGSKIPVVAEVVSRSEWIR